MLPNLYVVVREFEADRPLKAGEIVDVSAWRNAAQLQSQRRIRPATPSEIAASQATEAEPAARPKGRTVPSGE